MVGERWRVSIMAGMTKLHWVRQRILGSTWFDFLIPWDKPFTPQEADAERQRKTNELAVIKDRIQHVDCETLKQLMTEIAALMELETERRRSVDTRLATIVGLSSVAATVATGVIIAQAAGTLHVVNIYARWALSAMALYIITQLCDAIYWAVQGQALHGYRTDTVDDIVPKPPVTAEEQLRQRIITWVEQIHFNQNSINSKVTAMAVAHQATKNFVSGLVVLSIVATLTMALSGTTAPPVEQIQTDATLRGLLRGPAGPTGPQGQTGPVGPIGPAGPKGDAAPREPKVKQCHCAAEHKR